MTNNGLGNDEFKSIRIELSEYAQMILETANSKSGHLGDIVSGLKTVESLIEHQAKEIHKIFENQKKIKH